MVIHEDVWAQLDLASGQPERLGRRWRVAGAITALAVVIAALLGLSGAVVPRISQWSGGGSSNTRSSDELSIDQEFRNDSWLPITITGVSIRAEGMRLSSVGPYSPVLRPGQRVTLDLGIQVVDCTAALTERAVVLFEVHRWWGSTVVAAEQGDDFDPWQNFYVSSRCEPRR
ncbi:hypothetical protein ACIBG8_24135 [Nonomuraea sp. NPDC050556]|uniref:hypothetical protein n=1 Tax=Nonomuraea sp. NPDC050556 TaxID=3364369 RepID=UPI0037964EF4